MAELGEIKWLNPRDAWHREDKDFTPWLIGHIGQLCNALGLEIEEVDSEVSVGSFSVDLVGQEVGSRKTVIIENQLEPTNHDHLGKLLTYAAGKEGAVIIWIATEIRDEHREALDWLNEKTREDIGFFGVELELLQIGDSLPAPHFKVVASPNEWGKRVRTPSGITERQQAYHDFFVTFLEELKNRKPDITRASRVGYDSWFNIPVGKTGFAISFAFGRNRQVDVEWTVDVELYIDTGDKDANKKAFDLLQDGRGEIEKSVGTHLSWERLDNRRASRIAAYRQGRISDRPEKLSEILAWGIETVIRFRQVFAPYLQALEL